MPEIRFNVPGEATGKGRPRSTKSGTVYTPQQTRSAEMFVTLCAKVAMGSRPLLAGPVRVSIWISVGIPASWPKVRKARALSNLDRPTGNPDIDNVAKLIADAMNGVVYADDKAIVDLSISKMFGEVPCVSVIVKTLNHE